MEVASLQLSPQHYYKNSWKSYIVMFTCIILLYSFSDYSFQIDILFHWCSAFAGMCQILPTANIKFGRKLNVLLLVLMYVYHISSLNFELTEQMR